MHNSGMEQSKDMIYAAKDWYMSVSITVHKYMAANSDPNTSTKYYYSSPCYFLLRLISSSLLVGH
jgi:hypothetical protein